MFIRGGSACLFSGYSGSYRYNVSSCNQQPGISRKYSWFQLPIIGAIL